MYDKVEIEGNLEHTDMVATHVQAPAPSYAMVDGSIETTVGPPMMKAIREKTSFEGGVQKNDESRKKVLPTAAPIA